MCIHWYIYDCKAGVHAFRLTFSFYPKDICSPVYFKKMKITFRRLFNPKMVHNLRSFYTSSILRSSAYDGPGKTTVTVINKVEDSILMIDGYDPMGFQLNNGIKMVGPMIIFARSLLFWNVASARDISKDSLMLFDLLEPKLDLLILGLENHYEYKFILNLKNILKDFGIKNEIYPVDKACTAFNFVCSEGRYAAAALIPPTAILTSSLSSYRHHLKNVDKKIDSKKLVDDK